MRLLPKIELMNSTGHTLIYYYLLSPLFFLSVATHAQFGIASHSLNIAGVLIGAVFCFLTAFLLMKHLFLFMFRHFSSKDYLGLPTGRLHIAERTFNFLGWCFLFVSVMVYINSRFDSAQPVYHSAKITKVRENRFPLDYVPRYTSMELNIKDPKHQNLSLVSSGPASNTYWNGEPLRILLRQGHFGLPWIDWYERDDEAMSKEVLKELPNAVMAWKSLLNTYIHFADWNNLVLKGQEYLKINPTDYYYFETMASVLTNAFHDREALPFYEHVVSHIPSAQNLLAYGIGLHNSGDNKKAVTILEEALLLDPNDSEIYFFLGVAHYDLREWKESLTNFQKVLEFRPNFPQVESLISDLKIKLEAA